MRRGSSAPVEIRAGSTMTKRGTKMIPSPGIPVLLRPTMNALAAAMTHPPAGRA